VPVYDMALNVCDRVHSTKSLRYTAVLYEVAN